MSAIPEMQEYSDASVTGNEIIISVVVEMDSIVEDLRYALIHDIGLFHAKTALTLEGLTVMLMELGIQYQRQLETARVRVPKGMAVERRRNPHYQGSSLRDRHKDDPNADYSGAAFNSTPDDQPW